MYLELRFHGRGGEGAVTAATILARAVVLEGKYAQAIPNFNAERRGAPVEVYSRISDKPIEKHSQVKNPDVVIVLDYELIKIVNILDGLKPDGIVIVNSPVKEPLGKVKTYCVDATRIAKAHNLVISGWPTVNTAMLGTLPKALGIVSIDSITKAIEEHFSSPNVAKLNSSAALDAYKETILCGDKY
ncbi:MAG: 2-oxoacid:acceptor oxidoreductase family protein [Caldisphaera sp.]|jgi:2-oxoacid:acceptor oxidoreductase gamma subunit (pyruvate/2-ketoisovalerate family)|nr:2-oxoacid:acceptor oxidoreductase family protein [Caldisphaera sp.]PMP59486.1 MAG: pyruvate ferredoxin oxidoreductase [Caldisphaera sp.]